MSININTLNNSNLVLSNNQIEYYVRGVSKHNKYDLKIFNNLFFNRITQNQLKVNYGAVI